MALQPLQFMEIDFGKHRKEQRNFVTINLYFLLLVKMRKAGLDGRILKSSIRHVSSFFSFEGILSRAQSAQCLTEVPSAITTMIYLTCEESSRFFFLEYREDDNNFTNGI